MMIVKCGDVILLKKMIDLRVKRSDVKRWSMLTVLDYHENEERNIGTLSLATSHGETFTYTFYVEWFSDFADVILHG